MNLQQLVEQVSDHNRITKQEAERIVKSTMGIIKKSVKKGDDVKIIGFGTFTKMKRKARMGRNPQTGQSVKIPAKWSPKFRPGAEFKELVK